MNDDVAHATTMCLGRTRNTPHLNVPTSGAMQICFQRMTVKYNVSHADTTCFELCAGSTIDLDRTRTTRNSNDWSVYSFDNDVSHTGCHRIQIGDNPVINGN